MSGELPPAARIRASIHLERLRRNLVRLVARARPARVLAVIKANAYGHGAVTCARALEPEPGLYGFGVACPAEGVELRAAGIRAPIVVLGGLLPAEAHVAVESGLTVAVDSVTGADALAGAARAAGRPAAVHLAVDTGMSRLGVDLDGAHGLADHVRALAPHLRLDGVLSHLSSAEGVRAEDAAFTRGQAERFLGFVTELRRRGIDPGLVHLANSAGILFHESGEVDLVRPGLALYGITPGADRARDAALEPVLTLETVVLRVRDVPAGTAVSYGRLFTTTRASRLAVLAAGYADGLPVALGNRASVLVRGARAPVVGAVTMDMTVIDVTGIDDRAGGVRAGDRVTLIGAEPDAPRAEDLARWAGTIPYEIVCGLGPRVARHTVPEEASIAVGLPRGAPVTEDHPGLRLGTTEPRCGTLSEP